MFPRKARPKFVDEENDFKSVYLLFLFIKWILFIRSNWFLLIFFLWYTFVLYLDMLWHNSKYYVQCIKTKKHMPSNFQVFNSCISGIAPSTTVFLTFHRSTDVHSNIFPSKYLLNYCSFCYLFPPPLLTADHISDEQYVNHKKYEQRAPQVSKLYQKMSI